MGSPGKNGTNRKLIQRRLIIILLSMVAINEIVALIVCYRALVTDYTYAEGAMHAPMIIHNVAAWIFCCSISQDVYIERQPRPRDVPPSTYIREGT